MEEYINMLIDIIEFLEATKNRYSISTKNYPQYYDENGDELLIKKEDLWN